MAFKPVLNLDADFTISLGGTDKKTGKKNPNQLEGYYIGSRDVESKKTKSGFCKIYFFQTEKGMIGLWGKTDLDRKMVQVKAGTMTLVKHTGFVVTPNGEMYKYSVAVDADNTIDVDLHAEDSSDNNATETSSYTSSDDDAAEEEAEEPIDEPIPPRAAAPSRPATTPDAARQAKVQALLNRNTNRA